MGKDRRLRGNRESSRRGGFGRGSFGRGGFRGGPRGRGFGGNYDGNFGNRFNWQNRPKKETPGKRLSEEQIGVTEYMSEHESFNGIIKSRYSDFQVSEINRQGEVAKLTTLSPPELPADEVVDEDEELLLSKYNVEILPLETWDQINKVAIGTTSEPVEIDVSTSSKEDRTKIHDAVKKAFGESIVGSTLNIDDKKLMRFTKYKKGVRIDRRVKWRWPAEYVHFVLYKENCDTMDAALRVAERLGIHIKQSMVGYAGTKDRRAKTSQWFSLRKVDPRKISVSCKDLRDIHIGDFSFHADNLQLGMLQGNKFRIALRNVTASEAVVQCACESLRDRGFINYYGLQRFGTRVQMPTFEIGMKLLQGKFQEAIECILEESEGPMQEALRVYKCSGASAALQAVPRYSQARTEARLLQALAEHPNDLLNALQRVPRNTRLLYLHSYQSLIWNRAVSERIRRFGLTPAAGDLVPLAQELLLEEPEDEESESEENENNIEKPTEPAADTTEKLTEDTTEKPIEDTTTTTEKSTDKKPDNTKEKQKCPVKIVTQEDVDNNSYTIFDVIMPLPGYLIEYPPNMKDYYEQLLKNDGLKLELKQKNKSYSTSGAYRPVAVRPTDVTWRCVHYSDPYADLILSDLDEIQGTTLSGIVDEGPYKALLLTMSLPASCYATMALRELLRTDTSADTQAAQNNYHKRKLPDATTQDNTEEGKRLKENDQ